MSEPLCVLCGEPLKKAPVNREHYVPATAIRKFDKLRIPKRFTHALRIDMRDDDGEATIAPISAHKHWATVKTHVKCNSDASHMCQDMSYIINNPKTFPDWKVNSILEYYAHIWGMDSSTLELWMLDDGEVDDIYKGLDAIKIYTPGQLVLGKLNIVVEGSMSVKHDYEKHTIWLGTESALDEIAERGGL